MKEMKNIDLGDEMKSLEKFGITVGKGRPQIIPSCMCAVRFEVEKGSYEFC